MPSPISCEIAARSFSRRGLRDAPSRVDVTDAIGVGNPHIGEEDLVEVRATRELPQRSHVDAGRAHVETEVGDPLVLRHVGIGAHEQHPAVASGAHPTTRPSGRSRSSRRRRAPRRAQRREIGSGARLAEELAPDLLAAQESAEPTRLLLVGSVRDHGGACEHDPDAELVVGDVESCPFLVVDDLLGERDAPAAVLDAATPPRPSRRRPRAPASPWPDRCPRSGRTRGRGSR